VRSNYLNRILPHLISIQKARQSLFQVGVIRSERDVVVDYAEWLAKRTFKLRLVKSGVNKTYDATDNEGKKYQIKARRVSSIDENTSFDFHNYARFDYLIAVLISRSTMRPLLLRKIPFSFVKKHWKQNKGRRSFRWNRKIRQQLVPRHGKQPISA